MGTLEDFARLVGAPVFPPNLEDYGRGPEWNYFPGLALPAGVPGPPPAPTPQPPTLGNDYGYALPPSLGGAASGAPSGSGGNGQAPPGGLFGGINAALSGDPVALASMAVPGLKSGIANLGVRGLGILGQQLGGQAAAGSPGMIGTINMGNGPVAGTVGVNEPVNMDTLTGLQQMMGTHDVSLGIESIGAGLSPAQAVAAGAIGGMPGQEGVVDSVAGLMGSGSSSGGGGVGTPGVSIGGMPGQEGVSDPGGGGDGGGKVICTELYRQGLMPEAIYRADQAYGRLQDADLMAGYHAWAMPFVRLMRRSRLATMLAVAVATPWAIEMAYRMQVLPRGSRIGAAIMAVGYPLCRCIGRRRVLVSRPAASG